MSQIHLILYSVQSLVFPNLPPQKKTTRNSPPSDPKNQTLLQTHPPCSRHLSQNWFIYWIPLKILKKNQQLPFNNTNPSHPSPPPNPTKACETSRPPRVSVVDLLLAASRPRSSTVPRTKDPWEHSCRGGKPRTWAWRGIGIMTTTYLPTYLPTFLPTYLSSYLPTFLPTYLTV